MYSWKPLGHWYLDCWLWPWGSCDRSLKHFLTPTHVWSEAELCCCDSVRRPKSNSLWNIWVQNESHNFFTRWSTLQQEFEWLSMVRDTLTHMSIESSWKNEFIVFSTNPTVRAMEKAISDLQKLTKIVFCYKRGCDSTTVKLVLPLLSPHQCM